MIPGATVHSRVVHVRLIMNSNRRAKYLFGGFMATLGDPKNTIAILNKYHFSFQKKFGQNFLIDKFCTVRGRGLSGTDGTTYFLCHTIL